MRKRSATGDIVLLAVLATLALMASDLRTIAKTSDPAGKTQIVHPARGGF